jgi:hypothetical protein
MVELFSNIQPLTFMVYKKVAAEQLLANKGK